LEHTHKSILLEPFEPIAQIDQFVKLIPQEEYYVVKWIEPLPDIIRDFGAIGAEGVKEDVEVDELYLEEKRLGQYRIIPLDDITIEVKQPKAGIRYATKKVIAIISFRTVLANPAGNIREIYVWENGKIFFTVKNPRKYDIAMSRVMFLGYQYMLEPVVEVPKVYTVVPTQAILLKG